MALSGTRVQRTKKLCFSVLTGLKFRQLVPLSGDQTSRNVVGFPKSRDHCKPLWSRVSRAFTLEPFLKFQNVDKRRLMFRRHSWPKV